MIKVLHFFKTYFPDTTGGIEQAIFQLAEGGGKYGIESEVLYLSKRGSSRNEKLENHIIHRSKQNIEIASTGFSLSAIQDFKELANKADVIHFHFPWPYMDILHLLSGLQKPTVLTYHSDIVKQSGLMKLYKPIMNRFLSGVDRIVASSPNYVKTSPVLNKYIDKVQVIPYGLDEDTYPEVSDEKINFWKARFGEDFFLFVGKLRYYKGLNYLLAAVESSDLKVLIVGEGGDEKELKAQAKKRGLNNVHFLGALPDEDKVALLTLCYAFVFPSHLRSEAFGISLLEAAMFGKPMISCEIGTGTTYINIEDETGLVISPEAPNELREAMVFLLDNPELAQKMGQKAQARFKEFFSSEKMVSSYVRIYEDLVS